MLLRILIGKSKKLRGNGDADIVGVSAVPEQDMIRIYRSDYVW